MDNLLTPEEIKQALRNANYDIKPEFAYYQRVLIEIICEAQLQKYQKSLLTTAPDVREYGTEALYEYGGKTQHDLPWNENDDDFKNPWYELFDKAVRPLILAAADEARREEREMIANKTFDYFKTHMPKLIDALTMSGDWQRIFHDEQSLGGKE